MKIVASSGFTPDKCRMMAVAEAPIDVVGTGSFLPEQWAETYATADIIAIQGEDPLSSDPIELHHPHREVRRTIHSFDPCMAGGIHLTGTENGNAGAVQAL